jgi:hypothetical protein
VARRRRKSRRPASHGHGRKRALDALDGGGVEDGPWREHGADEPEESQTLVRGARAVRLRAWEDAERCCGCGDRDTWLILPVMICLSQRLSHACVSINLYTVKLRMAH